MSILMNIKDEIMNIKDELGCEENKANTCKGLVFKGYVSNYYNFKLGTIESKKGLRLLKRKSCNCGSCCFFFEDISNAGSVEHVIIPDEIVQNCLYGVRMVNISTDWETGTCDDWEWEFYKLPVE